MRRGLAVAALLIGLAGGARAEPPLAVPAAPGPQFDPGVLFAGVITERDVALLAAYARAALVAAATGTEPPAPEDLTRRAEAIAGELKLRGMMAGLLLLDALEARASAWVRERQPRVQPPLKSTSPPAPD